MTGEAAKTEGEGEQLPLLDVGPEHAQKFAAVAREYKRHQAARLAAGSKEKTKKEELKSLIRDSKLTPLEDGIIRFRIEGLLIEMTPRDELITVKEEAE